jgi:5-(carboxyamino)imidazole ribonucleotide mutase
VAEPVVAVVMGSRSDWETMKHACDTLEELGVPFQARVLSAHRTPEQLAEYVAGAAESGFKVFVAGAGGAAALPGAIAAYTHLPVLGVPMESHALRGMDSLLSMVQMPAGIPVGTLAIGKAGAINAAILAASIVAIGDDEVRDRLQHFRSSQSKRVLEQPDPAAE